MRLGGERKIRLPAIRRHHFERPIRKRHFDLVRIRLRVTP
jgi:hypothetical protein